MQYDHPTAFSSWRPGDGSEEDQATQRVLASGQLTMGPEVAALEREFADFHGRAHGVMVNSGSSANLVAVAALFCKNINPLRRDDDNWRGRHAVVPALAWATTYAPLVQHGLKLVLADCDDTWNAPLDERDFPSVAVICSILGNPCYGEEWQRAAINCGAYLIEDNCESFAAVAPGGQLCGNHGLLSTFSFFWSHQISGIEGGMVLTDNDDLADKCRMLRAHGWTRDVAKAGRFDQEYDFRVMGYNVRPLEMHAAVAREQLKKTAQFQAARWSNFVAFRNLVRDVPVRIPTMRGTPNPFGLHFLCEREADRADLVAALRANGIDCRPPTGGSLRLHRYGAPYANQATPMADEVHRRGLFLGNAPFDISGKIEKAVRVMRAVFDAKARAA
jgi:CDP-6-deoxy-D-xylo-4-hexulose-3-dehydrase